MSTTHAKSLPDRHEHPEPDVVQILLIEDDDIDAEIVRRAFASRRIANPLHRAGDGVAALEMLRGSSTNGLTLTPLARPFLILLDLNMPRMNGIEFLHTLRDDPLLHDSLVFVLTTSDDDRDKVAAYARHVAGYLVKSRVGDDFVELVNMLECYWRYVEFPPTPH